MAVSEPQRLALHRAAQAALGEEEGDTLMALSPPANTDMTTRQDVEQVRELLNARMAEVNAFIGAAEARVTAQMERMGSNNLRWTVGTILAGYAAVIAILGSMLR